jgi:DNA-binding NarL/FixJ family response regulator
MVANNLLKTTLDELRSLAHARRRRAGLAADAAPLLARLITTCRTLAVEERSNGIAFRLESGEADSVRLTCIVHQATPSPLTSTEAAVAEQLCEDRTLAQIARLRGVSVNTIKSQVRQIFRKLNVDSRVALVRRMVP